MSSPEDSFPRRYARTQRFTLGTPRNLSTSPDGGTVLFVRTPTGVSRTGVLRAYDVASGDERVLADPVELLGSAGEDLSPEERARRERSRESGAGIIGYTTDDSFSTACFALSGHVWVTDVATAASRELPTTGAVIDPRIDPTGRWIAYAADSALRVIGVDGGDDRALVEPDGDEVVWGQAEFVAAEEMDRMRGFWWAPDGESLLVERYDNAAVPVWWVADPANPELEPVPHRYPAAGTTDADVELWHVTVDGESSRIAWDIAHRPYLTRVSWTAYGAPLIQVMSRDQRVADTLSVDLADGTTSILATATDPAWVELVDGVPTWAPGGRLVLCVDAEDTRRVSIDGNPVSPVGLQVRAVLGADDDGVLVSASTEPTEVQLVRIGYDGETVPLTAGSAVYQGISAGGTTVVTCSSFGSTRVEVTARRKGEPDGIIANVAEDPGFRPEVTLLNAGERELRTAVLFPAGHLSGSVRLPVIMAPYGGPHAQMVLAAARPFLDPQWLADQGFCVVVADGRGSPGRGPAWEKAVRDDFARVTLQDQVDALAAVTAAYPDDVDPDRVGMTGWSYGGYLSALAVLARPDVFRVAVAGAPVTEWRLYDTFYTERYLGHPDVQPEVYDANSLLPLAEGLDRPLMIVHGLVDDNVVVAHSLRLSSALLAAGRPHTVLPLTGVTHMTSQEIVAENLKLLQLDFLRRALS